MSNIDAMDRAERFSMTSSVSQNKADTAQIWRITERLRIGGRRRWDAPRADDIVCNRRVNEYAYDIADYIREDVEVIDDDIAIHDLLSQGPPEMDPTRVKDSGGALFKNYSEWLPVYDFLIYTKREDALYRNGPQNKIIVLQGRQIREQILAEVRASRYSSIIADGTIGTGKIDQLTLVIRYVFRGDIKQSSSSLRMPREERLFIYTGETIAGLIQTEIKSFGL
ncbi:hypothetical protein RvY_01936 [Ramazzottius varieornatus]|uniref:Uncharacterized protein n=1 Tax=Ramazzottius varieornatus TaxID=947166 RepID=A0A1D1UIW3_RAMVA|nr:hypothetical protein RvY_01936 [Ramazzottius varieornatus]